MIGVVRWAEIVIERQWWRDLILLLEVVGTRSDETHDVRVGVEVDGLMRGRKRWSMVVLVESR